MSPQGMLAMQTLAMPADTNANGDIFGGWLVSQMDLAASIFAKRESHGRTVTAAIKGIEFLLPVQVGDVVSCYVTKTQQGRTSMHLYVEVWTESSHSDHAQKVALGEFVFVAIDAQGRPRPVGLTPAQ
jgi:acyl-CoA thioesterase YciA